MEEQKNSVRAGSVSTYLGSLSTQLQLFMIILSLLGIGFAVKNYLHFAPLVGAEASRIFLDDLFIQIIITLAANLIIGIIIHKIFTLRMKALCEAASIIAESNENVEVPYLQVNSEIGAIARYVNTLKQKLSLAKKAQQEKLESERKSEYERKALLTKVSDYLTGKIKQLVETISKSSRQIELATKQATTVSKEICHNVEGLKADATQASSQFNSLIIFAGELATSIQNTGKLIAKSLNTSQDAVRKTELASNMVNDFSSSAEKISLVIKTMHDLSEQINILALNTAIEAARAGDAGKGFAVIASEIKHLAVYTSKSADEIDEIVRATQSKAKMSLSSVVDISTVINEMNNMSADILSETNANGTSATEVSENVIDATSYVTSVSGNLDTTFENITKNDAELDGMLSLCKELTGFASDLDAELNNFIKTIKNH